MILDGVIGGVVATIVLTVVMKIATDGGKMELSPPKMLSEKMGIGDLWMVVHFVIGTTLGVLYVVIADVLSLVGNTILYATVYAVTVPWIILGAVLLPMNDSGFFGSKKSSSMPMMSFVMHVVFGLALGITLSVL